MAEKPQIPSGLIEMQLDHVASKQNADTILAGAFLSVLDGFDRRINRDPFVDILNLAAELHESLGRLVIVENCLKALGEGKLTKEELEDARVKITGIAEQQRVKLAEKAHLVSECSTPEQTKH